MFADSVAGKTLMAGLSRIAVLRACGGALLLLVLALLTLACASATAQTAPPQTMPTPLALEQRVKAAYLFKFAGFVEWPEGSFERADSALVIGIAGADQLADQLALMVAGRSIGGHPLTVRKVERGEAVTAVHILYLGPMERGALAEPLGAARGHPVLTVCDGAERIDDGCMIAFLVANERLRFDVGMKTVAGARLRISARMLAAAHRVQGAT